MTSKNQVNRKNIFTGKNTLFLKVQITFYEEISKVIV